MELDPFLLVEPAARLSMYRAWSSKKFQLQGVEVFLEYFFPLQIFPRHFFPVRHILIYLHRRPISHCQVTAAFVWGESSRYVLWFKQRCGCAVGPLLPDAELWARVRALARLWL